MFENPNQTIFYTIEKTIKEYRRFAQRNIQKLNTQITVDQTLLLLLIDEHPDLSQNEIGDVIFKNNASITRMVELLVKRNHLNRSVNQEDRRKTEISLTDEGKLILQDLTTVVALNCNDYHLIRNNDAPRDVEVHFVESDVHPKGLGELPFAPAIGALANALHKETGKRYYHQPFMVDIEKMYLQEKESV